MPKGKRHNGKEFRKHLVYQISTNQLINTRRKPAEIEIQTLFTAINKNQISLFGVEKLSQLDLNHIYNISPNDEQQYKVVNESDTDDSDTHYVGITLIQYAILLSRDHIICALYKAGANPFINACQCTSCVTMQANSATKPILSRLKLRHYQNIIWILRVVNALSCLIEPPNECTLHTNCHTHTKDSDTTTTQITHNTCTITFPTCQHTICKLCFWLAFIDMDPLCDICCPVCHTELTTYPLNKHTPKNNRHNKYTSNLSSSYNNSTNLDQAIADMSSLSLHLETNSDTTTDTTESLLSSTKGDSYKRWAQLPKSSELLPIPARPSFMAHSLTELAGLYLGEVSTVHICILHASFDIQVLTYTLYVICMLL